MNFQKTLILMSPALGAALLGVAVAQNKAPAAKPLISDDFESGAINTNLWDVRQSGAATVSITQDKVAHGKNALKIHYPAGTARAWGFVAAKLPDSLHDHLYGRAYVYLGNVPNWNHNVFLSAGSPGWPNSNFLEIGDDTGKFKPSFQQNGTGVPRGEITYKQGATPANRWFCLEWEFSEKPKEHITIWVDGEQVADQAVVFKGADSELAKGLTEFDIGFRSWAKNTNVTNDVDIYYDDVAISDKPIGQLAPVK